MKILFIGGIKSGKSINAQNHILNISQQKPIYLATTEFIDDAMREKIELHKQERQDKFQTIEEGLKLYDTLLTCQDYILVEDISMWINNMLHHNKTKEDIFEEIKKVLKLDKTIVFVINDVSRSVIAQDKLTRDFVDINGKVSQLIASSSQKVYNTTAGISVRIK